MHRGISQYYRGMESDLWAIYNKEFDKLGVTIHFINETLDTGSILSQENFTINKKDEIYHLRYKWSVLGTNLIESVIDNFKPETATKQPKIGEYFSMMPIEKKYETLKIFNEYKQSL